MLYSEILIVLKLIIPEATTNMERDIIIVSDSALNLVVLNFSRATALKILFKRKRRSKRRTKRKRYR